MFSDPKFPFKRHFFVPPTAVASVQQPRSTSRRAVLSLFAAPHSVTGER